MDSSRSADENDRGTETHAHNRDVEPGNESTPLLRQTSHTTRDPKRLSIIKLLTLTCINGGVQVFFSTVMANLAPYLQSLGLSKSATAAITICLPLSGAFIGPMSGAYSDRFSSRWGRRRLIILFGTFFTIIFLLLLAWAQQLVPKGTDGNVVLTIAITSTILMSVVVQPVQTGVRSLMVDMAPSNQQNRAWSWAGRVQGVAAIFSFFASSLTLPSLPGLGRLTQFQALACLNLITLGSTVLITCVFIPEKDSRRNDTHDNKSIVQDLKNIFQTIRRGLPGRIRQTCKVQLSSWMAWFPLLYYTTTFIGELDTAGESSHKDDGNELAQAGSLGSLSFATIGFIFVTILPIILPKVSNRLSKSQPEEESEEEGESPRNLIWLWILTQPLLGILELLTLAAAYQWQGIVLVAAAGLPWAVTQWVPHAIVGYEISRLGLTGEDEEEEEGSSQAGAILGVHNMAISLPQVVAGLIASAVYKIADVAGSQVPTSWVLALSGLAAFLAAYLAKQML